MAPNGPSHEEHLAVTQLMSATPPMDGTPK